MNYGYLRVSTSKQDLDNQRAAILEYANKQGITDIGFIEETISSKLKYRQVFGLVEELKEGDTLIVFELSRLARSMKELESIRVKVAEAGADIHAVSQNLVIKSDGNDIATKAVVFALELSAEIERNMISERTRNALALVKARGGVLGRPAGKSKLDSKAEEIKKYLDLGVNITNIAKIIECSRATLNNWIQANGDKLKSQEKENDTQSKKEM